MRCDNLLIEVPKSLKNYKLPDKLSDLIEMAIECTLDVMEDPRFTFDFSHWIEDSTWSENVSEGKCAVSFAGALLASILWVKPRSETDDWFYGLFTSEFDTDTRNKIHALHCFSMGAIEDAFSWVERDLPDGVPYKIAVGIEYSDIPNKTELRKFIADMRRIAKMLRKHGE